MMRKLEKQQGISINIEGSSNTNIDNSTNESSLCMPLLQDASDESQQRIVAIERVDQNGDKNINNNLEQDNGNRHNSEEDAAADGNADSAGDDEDDEYDDEYDDNDSQASSADASLTSSKLFDEIYNDNRILIILMSVTDLVMSIIGFVMQFQGCEQSDLQDWNQQWTWYFLAKGVYHGLIQCQFRSKSLTLLICQDMGELRTAEENTLAQQHFENQLNERQRALTRRVLEKQMMDFYYKRNGLLKVAFYVKSLVTLSYVLYGMVVFFKGDYFAIWITNAQAERNCEYAITWWTYLSVILVIACNRQIFDIVLIIVILIPVAIFGYLPYMAYKACKNKRKRAQAFRLFKKFKYAAGKVSGDSECAICRMDYLNGEKITVLPCNELHHFHDECITSWLNVNMSCPLCRFNFAVPSEGEEQAGGAGGVGGAGGGGQRRGDNDNNDEDEEQGGQGQQQPPQLQQQLIPVQQQQQPQPQVNNSYRIRAQSQPPQSQYQPPQYYPEANNNNNNNNNLQVLSQSQLIERSQQTEENPQHQQEQQLSIVQSHVDQLCTIFSNENELTTFMRENDYSEPLQHEILRIYRLTHINNEPNTR